MLLKYFLVFIANVKLSLLLVLPFDEYEYDTLQQIPQTLQDPGKPLILTPYLESNQIDKALELSKVESFLKDEKVDSNSGFLTVDKEHNSNLFFWFFHQCSDDWEEAPLLLWLQGGPGISSMYGVFEENGPYIVTEKGLAKRKYTWIGEYNVLYIDQPAGVGFSFTNSSRYIKTQDQVADHSYEALKQFFQLFPQLKKNKFYIAGEGYAGKYIPSIGHKIHNSKMANLTDINLKGFFMISAATEGLLNGYANFCFSVGIIDSQFKTDLEVLERQIEAEINSDGWKTASHLRLRLFGKTESASGVSRYDYRKLPAEMAEAYKYESFLLKPDTRKKIHVGNQHFESYNHLVHFDFFDDISKSVVPIVQKLVEHYPVAFVSGEFDLIGAYPLVSSVLEKLQWSGASEYQAAERKILNAKEVDGYIKAAYNLKNVLIRNAGHHVLKDQPRATFDLLYKFVNGTL